MATTQLSTRSARMAWIATGALLALCVGGSNLYGQERSLGTTAYSATAQERLIMEQIDQLAAAGQFDEALQNLERLVDNAEGRLVEIGPVAKAATLSLQVHGPIQRWAQWRIHSWSLAHPERLAAVVDGQQEQATRGSQQAIERHDVAELQKVVDRFAEAPASATARLFLSDLYLDRGWTVAARQALEAPGVSLRVPMQAGGATEQGESRGSVAGQGAGLPWPTAWPQLRHAERRAALLEQSRAALAETSARSRDELAADVAVRMVRIAAFDCRALEFSDTCDWASALAEQLPEAARQRLTASIQIARQWYADREKQRSEELNNDWPTFAGNMQRNAISAAADLAIGNWPSWTRQLERSTGSRERDARSRPPVAENHLGALSYHPVVHDGRVYINELTRILAFDIENGSTWPPVDPPLPVFDSGMTAANYLPFGYTLVGVPRGTLCISDGTLYARMGPPVTGWYGRAPANTDRSLSYVIALDLARQGSMRPGFPVRLSTAQFPDAEFEGSPLAVGDQVIVAVGMRDNVSLRRLVVSIDKETGAVLWRSPPLASGTVSGSEQASLVSHQLITASGGRVLVNTNLGAIACLDQASGEILWLARYRRMPSAADQPYPLQDRYRYRDLSPCMVVGTQVICAPQDCPEIFSVDITTGELLWSTDSESVDEATQLLGATDQSIVVAGDRIFWLDRYSGRVLAAFPAGTTSDAGSALPSPRGYGRGVVGVDRVYWPTQHEIFAFDADQSGRAINGTPIIRGRWRLDTHGAEGGNLVLLKDGVLIAGPSRLFVFKQSAKP